MAIDWAFLGLIGQTWLPFPRSDGLYKMCYTLFAICIYIHIYIFVYFYTDIIYDVYYEKYIMCVIHKSIVCVV